MQTLTMEDVRPVPPRVRRDLTGDEIGEWKVHGFHKSVNGVIFWVAECMLCNRIFSQRSCNLATASTTKCFRCSQTQRRQPVEVTSRKRRMHSLWYNLYRSGMLSSAWRTKSVFMEDIGQYMDNGVYMCRFNVTQPHSPDNTFLSSKQQRASEEIYEYDGVAVTKSEWGMMAGITRERARQLFKWISIESFVERYGLDNPRQALMDAKNSID